MPKRKKSSTIEEQGVRVRIFRRGDMYWLDARVKRKRGQAGAPDVARKRVSADTTDRTTAEHHARDLAREVARQSLFGIRPDTLTLSQVFDAYALHKGQALKGQWKRSAESRRRLFIGAWGDVPVAAISQTSVDTFSASRRREWFEKQGKALRDGALDCDFRWLSSVFNWALKHKLADGKRLLSNNPLHDCKWPREKNVRRPVASHERYLRTIERADEIDPKGRLRAVVALARYTGRRESAILALRAGDVLFSRDQLVAALATAGMDVGLAEHMPHGGIRWSDESDKQGILHITPIAPEIRAELERYLSANLRVGSLPLFPADENPQESLPRSTATKWLVRAERLAELPKLTGGIYHPYRRLWATERQHLSDVAVAAGGGWKSTKTLKVYQQIDPASVLAAVVNGGR